jgi:alginate O-acetyltransferase complex protein AlgI
MTLLNILAFAAVALAAGVIPRVRNWILFFASLLTVYWLQPASPVRNLDFWLPTASIGLAVCVWAVTARKDKPLAMEGGTPGGKGKANPDAVAASAAALTILAVALTRYFLPAGVFTPTRPPEIGWAVLGLVAVLALGAALWKLSARRWVLPAAIAAVLVLFVVLKTDALAQAASGVLRRLTGQSPGLAAAPDIRWLGFSYIAFRLIHTLRDRMTGRLPDCPLREFLTYVVFFPAVTAGPIDRVERFLADLRTAPTPLAESLAPGIERILAGVFKKFVLADGLAVLALNATVASQATATGWTWFFLYAYAFRIYFDFSGYTDIAIGLARWTGVALPENFNRPYLQPNLTAFWNSWHITLAQWFRSYFFNPLTRALRSSPRKIPMGLIIFTGQMATMALIGLWHGVSWNFLLWGCWHGAGLFLHNRWGEWSKVRVAKLESRPLWKKLYTVAGTLVTLQFVVLGWVWFALPSVQDSARVFLRLFGISG